MVKVYKNTKDDYIRMEEMWLVDENYRCPIKALAAIGEAVREKQTIYICGICGLGKTTLVEKYFDGEKYDYYTADTLGMDELVKYENVSENRIVVIDDLQFLPYDREDDVKILQKQILQLVYNGRVQLVLISRGRIPIWLAEAHYRKVFRIIDAEQLKMSDEAIKTYFQMCNINFATLDMQDTLKKIMGFGVAVKITAVEAKKAIENGNFKYSQEFSMYVMNRVFDYMEYRTFEKWRPEIYDFYIKLSIVSSFDAQLAECVTGAEETEKIIEHSFELGSFLKVKADDGENVLYEVIPYMQKLMKRILMRKYSRKEIDRLYILAGRYYEQNKQAVAAIEMYKSGHAQEEINRLLTANATKNPTDVDFHQLRKYYLDMPSEVIEKNLDLMTGICMLHSISFNVEESERWYEKIKKSLDNTKNNNERKRIRSKLAYLDVALPHRGTKGLIKILRDIFTLVSSKNIKLDEFSITSNLPSQMNGGKDFCEWSIKDRELAASMGKVVSFVLGDHGKALIDLALAESFFEKGGSSREIVKRADRGQIKAQSTGKIGQEFVAVNIISLLHLINGNRDESVILMKKFYEKVAVNGKQSLEKNVVAAMVRLELYDGYTKLVSEWMETQAPDEREDFYTLDRYRYLIKVRVYILQKRYEKAVSLLNKMLYYADIMKRNYIEIEAKILMAIARYRMGDDTYKEVFAEAYQKAKRYRFIRIFSLEGAALIKILSEFATAYKKTLNKEDEKAKSEIKYLNSIKRETDKISKLYPSYLKNGNDDFDFTEKTKNVLRLLGEGLSARMIADTLEMSNDTVKYHIKQIYKKLGVKDKVSAVMEARKRNLI